MRYTKSEFRKEFDLIIEDHKNKIKYTKSNARTIPYDIQQCIFRSVLFQTCSAIENYLENIFKNWIYLLKSNGKTNNHVPIEARYLLGLCAQKFSIAKYFLYLDETDYFAKVGTIPNLDTYYNSSGLSTSILDSKILVEDRKFPSSKNIKALFKRFGVGDIFHELQVIHHINFKLVIDSFLDKRNEIAHTYPPPNLTYKDVFDYLKKLQIFIKNFDRFLFFHIHRISGRDCWR